MAREAAQKYPRKWGDFEAALDKLFTELENGDYNTFKLLIFSVPTAGHNITGWLFIVIGAFFGIMLIRPCIGFFLNQACNVTGINLAQKTMETISFFAGLLSATVGAWLGIFLHHYLGEKIKKLF